MVATSSPFLPGSRVAVYVRDSGGDRQELSTKQQEQVVKKWAEENGIGIERIFADVARSAGSVVGRDAFREMIAYLETRPKISGVVIWSLNRFARDFSGGQQYLGTIRSLGYELYPLQDNIPSGNAGPLIESILLWMAQNYRTELSDNVKRGQAFMVRTFKIYPHPNAPVGLRKVPIDVGYHRDGTPRIGHRLDIDPDKAPLVKRAFELRAQRVTVPEINRQVGLFRKHDYYSPLFRNRIYRGIFVWGNEVVEDFCPAIIDPDLWELVQIVNAENGRDLSGPNHPRSLWSTFLLSSLVTCARCGAPMVGQSMKWKDRKYQLRYYRCNGRQRSFSDCHAPLVPADELEAQVLNAVKNVLLSPELLQRYYDKATNGLGDRIQLRRAELENARKDLSSLERRITNLTRAIAEAGHSRAILQELNQLENDRDETRERLQTLERTTAAELANFPEMTTPKLIELGRVLWSRIETGEFGLRKRLIRSVVHSVVAERQEDGEISGDITIDLAFRSISMDI